MSEENKKQHKQHNHRTDAPTATPTPAHNHRTATPTPAHNHRTATPTPAHNHRTATPTPAHNHRTDAPTVHFTRADEIINVEEDPMPAPVNVSMLFMSASTPVRGSTLSPFVFALPFVVLAAWIAQTKVRRRGYSPIRTVRFSSFEDV